jgi:hypothetical protein
MAFIHKAFRVSSKGLFERYSWYSDEADPHATNPYPAEQNIEFETAVLSAEQEADFAAQKQRAIRRTKLRQARNAIKDLKDKADLDAQDVRKALKALFDLVDE